MVGGWRLAVGGFGLAVGGWRLAVLCLAVGGFHVFGGWRLAVLVWRLAVLAVGGDHVWRFAFLAFAACADVWRLAVLAVGVVGSRRLCDF